MNHALLVQLGVRWLRKRYDRSWGTHGRCSLGKRCGAHRVSWELHRGPIPDGLLVLHDCPTGDNRACVNPAHLWLGTHADNTRDAAKKGRLRTARGEASVMSKLTAVQVLEIRALAAEGVPQREMAERFGVSRKQISVVASGKQWASIPLPTTSAA